MSCDSSILNQILKKKILENKIKNYFSRNIFLSYHNDLRKLVLGDLGHAKYLSESNSFFSKSRSRVAFGTDNYIAPELVDDIYDTSSEEDHSHPEKNPKLDVWFVSIICIEIYIYSN